MTRRKKILTEIGTLLLAASRKILDGPRMAPTLAPWILDVLEMPATATETEVLAELRRLQTAARRRTEVLNYGADMLVETAEREGKVAPDEREWLRENARADLMVMTYFLKHRGKVFTDEDTRRYLAMLNS